MSIPTLRQFLVAQIMTLFALGSPLGLAVAADSAADEYYVYLSIGNENKLAVYKLDQATGDLTAVQQVDVGGAPGALAVDPQRKFLYAAVRTGESVATLAIDAKTGKLTPLGKVSVVSNPVYLAVDKTGRYLLSAYYGAAKAAVYPIDKQGLVGGEATSIVVTDKNPHSIQPDPANRFAYVPNTGADKILQYRFDETTGKLTPAAVPEVATDAGTGPRHFYFHPKADYAYFVNEKGSSVTAFARDTTTGTLKALQTISTLPKDFSGNNSCAHIEITPDGKHLYASNRGHDSLACYTIDAGGKLTSLGNQSTEKTPRAFNIDPTGKYLYSAGQGSGKLAAYRIDPASGKLQPLKTYEVGPSPAWVLTLRLPRE